MGNDEQLAGERQESDATEMIGRRDLDKKRPPTLTVRNDGEDTFIVADGVTIAKRGRPGTAYAGTWISLEPGWTVSFNEHQGELLVKYEDVQVH
jgi:hypothetical protein